MGTSAAGLARALRGALAQAAVAGSPPALARVASARAAAALRGEGAHVAHLLDLLVYHRDDLVHRGAICRDAQHCAMRREQRRCEHLLDRGPLSGLSRGAPQDELGQLRVVPLEGSRHLALLQCGELHDALHLRAKRVADLQEDDAGRVDVHLEVVRQ
eukprot:scaffold10412_cov107-Isochrysis_galbana.AAC.6